MSVVLDKVTEIQDQVIDYLGSVKEPVVSGVEAVVGFVMAEFDFVGRLLDTNKEIAVAVVKAASPLTNKILDRKTVKAAAKKVAPKAAAKAA